MKHSKKSLKFVKILFLIIVLITVIMLFLKLQKNNTTTNKKSPKLSFPTTQTKGGGNSFSNKGIVPTTSSVNNSVITSPTGNVNNPYLIKPWGDFVSNHHPGEDGSPTIETSVCNTTPGASCYISFNNGVVTKSLPPQNIGPSGSVFWTNWNILSLGLSSGNWKITATAILNGQTKTSIDPMDLVVL